MNSIAKSAIAFGCVFGAALFGMLLGPHLPEHYRLAESKESVRLVMGLVVTTVAMALGLLVGSAKNYFDTQNAGMAQLAASLIMLDRLLEYYGPEAVDARATLRNVIAQQLSVRETRLGPSKTYTDIKSGAKVGHTILEEILKLSPADDDQKYFKQQSLNVEVQLAQLRWLMYEQNTIGFPNLLLNALIVSLILLFVSFGIFAPHNVLVVAGLLASAAVVSGAILLILEMYHPQRGLIRVSNAPLRAAMEQLGRLALPDIKMPGHEWPGTITGD
jgi:hypothetical protein